MINSWFIIYFCYHYDFSRTSILMFTDSAKAIISQLFLFFYSSPTAISITHQVSLLKLFYYQAQLLLLKYQ